MDINPLTALLIAAAIVVLLIGFWTALLLLAKRLRPGLLRDVLRFLPASATTAWRLRSQPMDTKVKAALVLALIWLFSPLDPIPDVVPLLGILDDVAIALVAIRYAAKNMDRSALLEAWPESAASLERFLGSDDRKN